MLQIFAGSLEPMNKNPMFHKLRMAIKMQNGIATKVNNLR
jgi:hypothetical protein